MSRLCLASERKASGVNHPCLLSFFPLFELSTFLATTWSEKSVEIYPHKSLGLLNGGKLHVSHWRPRSEI